ncbi:DUF4184 family protein [Pontibacter sp. 13R65]|uniref:DUF4184 family protein n=1 Tax=Pontibacter sp. 13R65 TaxID=3127458 RepID=UPI00301C6041
MPFTFSHPAIVLPLQRLGSRVSLTGLVIGSMAPDFEKLLKMGPGNTYSHTIVGVFWFSLPVSILLALLFHLVVRNALIDSLPHILRSRFYQFKSFDWVAHFNKHYKTIVVSVLIGAFSHLLWDAFTHKHSFVADMVPMLKFKYRIGIMWMPVYLLLQLISSLGGLLYIMYEVYRLPKFPAVPAPAFSPWLYWGIVVLVASVVFGIRYWIEISHVMEFIFSVLAAFLVGLILAPLLIPGKKAFAFRRP